ncbi:channel accessory protein ArfC, sunset domain variant [Mycolicibacter virginiensis]|uniref:channel accessory protein ArfC, sunset domain variant n=1 Tax=Mycolicibacter virginiensis TaxID=1795032 RepID=UPI001F0479B0|nr:hypothetical protein [Mycolicibacter virginiensis]ULP48400.1 hypothetical protein MJO54_04440 [Mycolicibacter virginiensis]
MHGVNCWLMGLSFLLGLLLTFAFTIRRVKREVPVSVAPGAAGPAASAPTAPIPAAGASTGSGATAKLAGGTLPSEAETSAMAIGETPYGAGSARAGAGGDGPTGWTIKGNEDSMLYHTTDSPWYDQTIAEVWFAEESAAAAAGFTRWDKGRSNSGTAKLVEVEEVPPGPFGPGSAKAGPGGSGPVGWTVKGNEDSMLYHAPASPAYDATIAEVWFKDEQTAAAAGFQRWDTWRKDKKKKK